MATAEELVAADLFEDNSMLIIDNDLRTIMIPPSITNLGVESDEDVLRLYFRMPKMYGEFDLSSFFIRINYINAEGQAMYILLMTPTWMATGLHSVGLSDDLLLKRPVT